MKQNTNSFYILQVSDFHISEDSKNNADAALKAVTDKISEMNINIKYLIHTGDIINSKDINKKIEEEHKEELNSDQYDQYLDEIVKQRFNIAEEVMEKFEKNLDVMKKNIIICCGNHDKVRYKNKEKDAFKPFREFLEKVGSHTELTELYNLDDLKVLVLNTNISDDKKVTCVDCENLKNVLSVKVQEECYGEFYTYGANGNISGEDNKVSVIVAHQPLYDICERIRLPYGSEIQTTDFLSALQDFINGNGIYLCGDKHTSSIAASYIHDIPHYFCGHPFVFEKNEFPLGCIYKDSKQDSKQNSEQKKNSEIDYNLIEIRDGKTGQVRKIHLIKDEDGLWKCQIHPIDAVVSGLYETSRKYIVKNSFVLLATQSKTRYNSWANLSWRNLFNRLDTGINDKDLKEISNFYSLFCRLKDGLGESIEWNDNVNIFNELCKIITKFMKENHYHDNIKNIMNIRGDYSSGKSTFLGLLYIFLLYNYSYGYIDYIPAYFNMENDDILNRIQTGSTYASAVKHTFTSFIDKVESIARIEHTSVCYIIDGLDEQDIWSESSQDSVGRVALDILSETNNSRYIMSFCQNRLARFKNTMSAIKYYEKSYVMYFNSVSVKEQEEKDSSFVKFIKYIISSNSRDSNTQKDQGGITVVTNSNEPKECSAIRKLRRLSINPGFIYHNYQYIKECKEEDSVNTVYMMYIDQQHQICLDTLGYNFVHYAPAMAYLFTYEGYTYEKFKSISPATTVYWERKILEYPHKIYKTFIFIKKHKDAREYLLALHYNRELRYFAENTKAEIPDYSIINRLIPRNISIIIKKLWRTDQNKFIIVCRNLVEKRKLNKCTLSMLIYILAYLDQIPDYICDEIKILLFESAKMDEYSMEMTANTKDPWIIAGENSKRMKKFIDLNFLHSQKILDAINSNSSFGLVCELLKKPNFALYNRQYMMWYYGDLTIYGENRINNLVPGQDNIHKGIDYYNCFYTLYHKIYAYFEEGRKRIYPLLEYDLFTIWDLVYSRQLNKSTSSEKALFYSEDEKEIQIYKYVADILNKYITYNCEANIDTLNINTTDLESNPICVDGQLLEKIITHLNMLNPATDKEYVHSFFKVIRKLFSGYETNTSGN